MLTCDNVSIKYESFYALRGISFSVADGDYLYIIGENGSGKSTLVKAILGLVPLSDGSIKLDRETGIGYLSQQTPVQNDFPASVFEIVLSGQIRKSGLFYTKAQKSHALEKMREMGIDTIKNRCFRELSGGMRQRVLLARALCASDSLLVLDEPLAGLDPTTSQELYRILEQLKERGMTIIMVSHDIDGALKYADKILHIGHGGYFFGTRDEYIRSGNADSFGGGFSK